MSKKINLEKINYILMILTIILLPILKMTSYLLEYNKIIEKSFEFNHVYFLWIMLPLLLVIYVIHLFKNYKKINYIDIIVYIIMILMLLTTIFSSNKDLSIYGNITRNEGLLTQLTYYLLFLNSRLITKEKYKENIIKVFIGTSIFIMLYSVLQVYTDIPFIGPFINKKMYAPSLCGNPNFYGSYMVMSSLLTSSLFLMTNKYKYLFYTFLFFIGLFISNSTGPFLAVIISLLFVLIFKFKAIKKINYILVIILLIISYFLVSFSFKQATNNKVDLSIKEDLTHELNESFGTNRIKIWKDTLSVSKDYLVFGCGLDNLKEVYPDKSYPVDKAHNIYLHILITNGLPALIMFLILIGIHFIKGLKLKDKLHISIFILFIGYLIQGFANISVIDVSPIFFIFFGLLSNKLTYK